MKKVIGLVVVLTIGAGLGWLAKWAISPTVYDFENGARLEVPWGVVSIDQRDAGLGIAVQADANVTVQNNSDEWRSLTVVYRGGGPAFEDLPPRSVKIFGADSIRYKGMNVSVSDYAQKKRDMAMGTK